jgi:hypothetical protein
VDANVLQGEFDHNVSQRFGVTRDRKNFFIRHRVRFIAKQFSALRSRERFRLLFRMIEYVHGAPLEPSRDDSCWMGGALWRVDVAVDAPTCVERRYGRSADSDMRDVKSTQ